MGNPALDRAERLRRIQREVSARAIEKGIGPSEVNAVVKRVLTSRGRGRERGDPGGPRSQADQPGVTRPDS